MVKMKCLPMMVLTLAVILVMFCRAGEARKRKAGRVCGLTCYRWKKCKGVLATLTSTSGATR
jgi:hypothetical protein